MVSHSIKIGKQCDIDFGTPQIENPQEELRYFENFSSCGSQKDLLQQGRLRIRRYF